VKTRLPGESQNTWRKPEYLMKTRLPRYSGFHQVFWSSTGVLVFNRYSGFHQVFWFSPGILVFTMYSGLEYLVKTRIPGENQNTC
jgi:hypothetical protein